MSLKIDEKKVSNVITKICRESFAPLKSMPNVRKVKGKVIIYYDVSWLVTVISSVHRICGASQDDILYKMPMSLAMRYHVQHAKEQGMHIARRTDDEILIAQHKRMTELVLDRLIEKGFVKEEDRDTVFEIMMKKKDTENES